MHAELSHVMEKLRSFSGRTKDYLSGRIDLEKKAQTIQSWVEHFAADPERARQIHNHAVDMLMRHNQPTKDDNYLNSLDVIQVDHFLHHEGADFPPFNAKDAHTNLKTVNDSKKEEMIARDYCQNILIASFTYLNRSIIGRNFFKSLELDQITAIIGTLEGDKHDELGTGQGKSTSIIPIAPLVQALVSPEKSAIVVSVNNNLVKDLQNQINTLITTSRKNHFNIPTMLLEKQPQEPEMETKSIQKEMMKKALTEGQYSPGLEEKIFKTFWGERFINPQVEMWSDKPIFSEIPKIIFMTSNQFAFNVSTGKDNFIKNAPHIFFDEIAAPYVMNEVYQTTREDLYLHPDTIIDSASRWLFDYMISRQINFDADVEIQNGEGTLSYEAAKKLGHLNLLGYFEGDTRPKNLTTTFNEGVQIIGKNLNLDQLELTKFKKLIRKHIRESVGSRKAHLKDYVEGVGNKLAQVHDWLNRLYRVEGDEIIVRSEQFDQLMERHKFDPDTQLAILALREKFNIIDLLPKAHYSIKFPSVIALLGNKIHGFSATLTERNPKTGKKRNSPFPSFLRDATGRDVLSIESPDRKKPPAPIIKDDKQQVIEETIKILGEPSPNQPLLLISHYDVETTAEIFRRISLYYPNELDVKLLPSLPSSSEKLSGYYSEVKKSCQALAEGKIKIIVSTGSLGIGANIVKSDNSFPDLKIGILGLPENESSLLQNFGRRRKAGSDFFWVVDRQSLRNRASRLSEQPEMLIPAYMRPKEALKKIGNLSPDDPEKNLEFVLRLIYEASLTNGVNDEIVVRYDHLFEERIIPMARYLLEQKIIEKYFPKNINWQGDDQKNQEDDGKTKRQKSRLRKAKEGLGRLEDSFGLPDSLYSDLLNSELTLGITTNHAGEFIDKLVTRIMTDHLVESTIDRWFIDRKKTAEQMERILYDHGKSEIKFVTLTPAPTTAVFNEESKITASFRDKKETNAVGTVTEEGKPKKTAIQTSFGATYVVTNPKFSITPLNILELYSYIPTPGGNGVSFVKLGSNRL